MGDGAGGALFVAGNATVIGDVTLAEGVSVWFGAVIRADKDRISIGGYSNIQDNAVVHTSRGFPVTLGAQVSVGHGAILHGCTIRDRVLVGMGAIVMNGADVGSGSLIAAGAVVTEGTTIPPGSVVMGVPGKVVRPVSTDQAASIVQNAESYAALAGVTVMREVAVIGAGVAGIQAALEIADHGIPVHLIEREPTIGGHMAMLDKTFPTNDCSLCILAPKMADVGRHPLIRLHTCTEVMAVKGKPGNYRLSLKRMPRYIDTEKCNGCGECELICPVEVYHGYDAGIGVRKAIYKPHPQAIPDLVVKDAVHCIECGLCYDICDLEAILKEEKEETREIRVASVVIATGYGTFDARKKPALGYLTVPDVITSLEFERLMNAAGPTGGKVRRLSTGEVPRSVVFIQCVGSRDLTVDRPWCSSVCCMSAIKNAILLREKHPDTEVTICYQDIRAYGKGYEEYYVRAERMGVRFLRGLPGEVWADENGPAMQVENTETREVLILKPDLVVLSIGLEPAPGSDEIADRFGIPREESGFLKPLDDKLGPVLTERPGIYLAGTATAPRDIPDCVAQGEAAAMRAFTDAIREE